LQRKFGETAALPEEVTTCGEVAGWHEENVALRMTLLEGPGALDDVPVLVWSSSDLPRDRASLALSRVSCFVVKPSSLDGFLEIGLTIGKLLKVPAAK